MTRREDRQEFIGKIRALEERVFGKELSTDDGMRMKSERYYWHFRPSHHAASGLLTEEDVRLLSQPGKRLLSLGAHPAFFERLLPQLGVPPENILLADREADITVAAGTIPSAVFDMTDTWPDIGTADRIIFPESLCTALTSEIAKHPDVANGPGEHPTDALEAELLAHIFRQALSRLRPGGIIRANGPMSHPNVFERAVGSLRDEGRSFTQAYSRFLVEIGHDVCNGGSRSVRGGRRG